MESGTNVYIFHWNKNHARDLEPRIYEENEKKKKNCNRWNYDEIAAGVLERIKGTFRSFLYISIVFYLRGL